MFWVFVSIAKGQIFAWDIALPWLVHSALPGSILPCPTEMRIVQNQSKMLFWLYDQQKGEGESALNSTKSWHLSYQSPELLEVEIDVNYLFMECFESNSLGI